MTELQDDTPQRSPIQPNPRTSKLSIISFIMGLLCLTCIFWPLMSLLAIVCGIIALVKISGSAGGLKGKGYAVTGIILASVMAVIILGARNFIDTTENARIYTTKATLSNLHEAVNLFKMDTGRYPTEEEGLNALIERPSNVAGWKEGGYLEDIQIPRDAWKQDFVYKLNPGDGHPFVIISYGADGKEGGEGQDADLYSTDLDK